MNRTPPIRLVKREPVSRRRAWLTRAVGLGAALFFGGLLILLLGKNPLAAYAAIVDGALGRPAALRQTITVAVPLLGCALAITPCFKMNFWNVGAEGQVTAGALAASYFALFWYDRLPAPMLLVVMALAAMVAGGVWGFIPAFFRAKWGSNETLFTLLMNYIIIGVVSWLQGGPWESSPRGSQIIAQFHPSAAMPKVFGVHCGWIVVLVLTAAVHVYLKYTKQGYTLSVIGDSERAARYAGMNVGRIMMRTVFLSGAVCGLMGCFIAAGANNTLYAGVANNVGFTAISVSWLAQLNPIPMVGVSALIAVLERGADALQTRMAIPASISQMMTAVVLFCLLSCEFFIQYRIVRRKKGVPAHE